MRKPLISIIILNWNGKSHLKECVESVLSTEYKPVEILVVDNGSTDRSLEDVQDYDRVHIIRNPTNLGYAAGNNVGVRHATGEYVVTLNNDIIVEADWLNEPIRYLERDSSIAIVSCRQMNYFERNKVDALYQVVEPHLLLGRFGHGQRYVDDPLFTKPGIVIGANGASAIYRRKVFLQLGGFNEHFFAYHEECDLQMRAFFRGYRCLYVPNAVVYHKSEASFGTVPDLFYYYHERNRIWFIYRNYPTSVILRRLPIILLRELRTAVGIVVLRRLPSIYYRARVHGFQRLNRFSTTRLANLGCYEKKRSQLRELDRRKKIPYH